MRDRRMRPLLVALFLFACLGLAPDDAAAQQPHGPTPKMVKPTERGPAERPARLLSRRNVDGAKAAVAAGTAGLLLFSAWLRRAGRPDQARPLRDALLAACGVAGLAAWWNFGALHYPHYAHRADNYLYFTGAKYFAELGYDRLYLCTAVAEAESGLADEVARRRMREVGTNQIVPAKSALEDRDRCKAHFSEARWQAFRRDVDWFRAQIPRRQWRRTQLDHGYNATPVWGILAIALSNTGPASPGRLLALDLLDPLLLLAMWGGVVWAFGWRAACVAAVFWGTNYFAHFGWTGGAILRQDWLAATVLGICLLRRGHPIGGGFLLGCAALIRVFPGLIFAGLGLQALASLVRRRSLRLAPEHARVAAGALLAAAVLLPLSALSTGPRAWLDFVDNSRVHLDTPLENYMGLKTVLSYQPGKSSRTLHDPKLPDPYSPWKQARRESFERRLLVFALVVAAYLALLARAVAGQPAWLAAALGIGLIPIAGELTCYYYAVLLGLGLLWTQREGVGVALCALSAVSWWIAGVWLHYDQIYTVGSVAVVALVIYATAAFAFRGGATPARAAPLAAHPAPAADRTRA